MKWVVLKWPSRFYQLLLQGEILIPRPSRADKQLFLVEKLLWSCEFSCFNKLHEASRFLFLWLFFIFFAESRTLIKEKLLNWSSICFSKVSHSPHTIMKYFSQIHVEPLLGPLEIILSEVCSIFTNCALQGDYEHEIIQPWLPVSWKYKWEGKQSPNSFKHS